MCIQDLPPLPTCQPIKSIRRYTESSTLLQNLRGARRKLYQRSIWPPEASQLRHTIHIGPPIDHIFKSSLIRLLKAFQVMLTHLSLFGQHVRAHYTCTHTRIHACTDTHTTVNTQNRLQPLQTVDSMLQQPLDIH